MIEIVELCSQKFEKKIDIGRDRPIKIGDKKVTKNKKMKDMMLHICIKHGTFWMVNSVII